MNGTVRPALDSSNELAGIYYPPSWATKINFISHLVLGTNVLVSVLGEHGGGKTTFAELLKAHLDPQITTCFITAKSLFHRARFLQNLGKLIGVQGESTLSQFAEEVAAKQRHTLIIVDEAHYLPAQFIDELLGLIQSQSETTFLHVCLISNYSLVPTLTKLSESVYPDLIHNVELGDLSETETSFYVMHRMLLQAGIITNNSLKEFYQLTEGNIVGINSQLAGFFGRDKDLGVAEPSPRQSYRRVGLIMGAFVLALGVAYTLQPLKTSHLAKAKEEQTDTLIAALPAVQEIAPPSKVPNFAFAAKRQIMELAPIKRVDLIAYQESEDESMPANELVVMDKVVVAPKLVVLKAEKPVETEVVAAEPKPDPVKPTVVAKTDAPPVVKQPARYTIQLLASRNRGTLEKFTKVHHLGAKAQILRTQKQNSAWYVLTYGAYQNRDEAKQEEKNFPTHLAKLNPWIRSVNELKQVG